MPFEALLGAAALVAGAIAAVAGFGIGSVLTPVLALQTGTKLAVAAIAIPHAIGTAQRYWLLRRHVERRMLVGFPVIGTGRVSGIRVEMEVWQVWQLGESGIPARVDEYPDRAAALMAAGSTSR